MIRPAKTDPDNSFLLSGEFPGDIDNQLLRRIKLLENAVNRLISTTSTATATTAASGSGVIMTGTHSDRVAIAAASKETGQLFFETDRATLYVVLESVGVKTWNIVP